jgi:hypothetical protein
MPTVDQRIKLLEDHVQELYSLVEKVLLQLKEAEDSRAVMLEDEEDTSCKMNDPVVKPIARKKITVQKETACNTCDGGNKKKPKKSVSVVSVKDANKKFEF